MTAGASLPWGYQWRSSQSFIITTATISLFSECFLFGFIVPILPYMLEQRLHLDPSHTQSVTTTLLTVYGLISLLSAPIIAHFADRTPHRKLPLLISLTACASGTILVACAGKVWILMAGQILQSLASASVWIVSMATLVDNVDGENKGKIVGGAMAVVATGVFAGPMVSGTLLELVGYWGAWAGALLLLGVDFVMRLVMIDNRALRGGSRAGKGGVDGEGETVTEETRLLPEPEAEPVHGEASITPIYQTKTPKEDDKQEVTSSTPGFYKIMLSNPQILAALLNTLSLSLILASFDTTLPLHVRAIFNWGSLPTGMIFLGLQAPAILFGSSIGWVRDRVGLRWPTTLGWAAMVPLLWLLGVPGHAMPWGELKGKGGEVVYILDIVGLGFAFAATRGAGTFQMMAVVHNLERQNPNIFGPYGGNSRLSGLTEVPFNLGMMLGPLVSGTVSEFLGYYWTNVALGFSGLFSATTATVSMVVTVTSWMYLTAGSQRGDSPTREDVEREGGTAEV